jgi:hypothetical protein
MKLRYAYLILAVLGAVLPLTQFVPATLLGEFSVGAVFEDLSASRITAGFTLDLLVASVVGLAFMIAETRRLQIRHTWIAVVGTFLIGFSFGLPFFLFLRERELAMRMDLPSQDQP